VWFILEEVGECRWEVEDYSWVGMDVAKTQDVIARYISIICLSYSIYIVYL